jgi:hypothetical protein
MKQETITIKLKKSDNHIAKVTVVPSSETIKDLKDRAFKKERDENKNIRLIF